MTQTEIMDIETLPSKPPLVAGRRPIAIVPVDIDQVWRIATIACESGMAPKDISTPAKATVAILHGLEIGLPPMMALQKIAVINGRPCVWGDAVPGIALATGQVEDWHEDVKGDGGNMVAVCTVKRKGLKSAAVRMFSVADAKTAGLWCKAIWRQYPKRMLTMRARIAFKDLFADAFGGLYIAEELMGIETDNTRAEKARDVTPNRPPPLDIDPDKSTVDKTTAPKPITADVAIVDPEELLTWIEAQLSVAMNGEALETIWNTVIEAKIADLLPADQEEAMAIYRKHEQRLSP
jgi:hypothetical protein